jgi:hypothetical protein
MQSELPEFKFDYLTLHTQEDNETSSLNGRRYDN